MAPTIELKDIPAAIRKKLNLKAPRASRSMDKNAVRTSAIRVLAVVADLTPAERKRVFAHAVKLNAI